jgi:outer membrane murein-binding lipoprotein Lpp
MKRCLAAILISSLVLAGCENIPKPSDRPLENWESGALIGAGIGAVVGAVAYSKDRTKGAVVGAVGGGLAGGAVGAYMDGQKKDLENNLAKEIQAGQAKVEELPNHIVRVTMTSRVRPARRAPPTSGTMTGFVVVAANHAHRRRPPTTSAVCNTTGFRRARPTLVAGDLA